mmetsp:Transcript_3505/g.5871  ORF Transcript_3505/g.5871 Transcript_3505/m.5871 type:complete len:289 (-) Transcript_3505:385-1251(-)
MAMARSGSASSKNCEGSVSRGSAKASRKKQMKLERLARERERLAVITAANAQYDLLSGFESRRRFNQNGLQVSLDSIRGDKLSSTDLDFCIELLQSNMSQMYVAAGWGWDSDAKRSIMRASSSHMILVRALAPSRPVSATQDSDWMLVNHPVGEDDVPQVTPLLADPETERTVGFVQIEFSIEKDRPVLYVIEIQLVPEMRSKGLGKFLMELAECIAAQRQMTCLLLTVFDANKQALDFYQTLGYKVDQTSPDDDACSYKILSKKVRPEAARRISPGSNVMSTLSHSS